MMLIVMTMMMTIASDDVHEDDGDHNDGKVSDANVVMMMLSLESL